MFDREVEGLPIGCVLIQVSQLSLDCISSSDLSVDELCGSKVSSVDKGGMSLGWNTI